MNQGRVMLARPMRMPWGFANWQAGNDRSRRFERRTVWPQRLFRPMRQTVPSTLALHFPVTQRPRLKEWILAQPRVASKWL